MSICPKIGLQNVSINSEKWAKLGTLNWTPYTIGLDNEALLGTDVLHDIKFNLDNKHQKRNRDFNALLYFLKNRMNERTIRQELFFNGIIEKQELDEYTSLALHSYRQVINWLKKKATNEIQIRAGI